LQRAAGGGGECTEHGTLLGSDIYQQFNGYSSSIDLDVFSIEYLTLCFFICYQVAVADKLIQDKLEDGMFPFQREKDVATKHLDPKAS
jgi:hypothetical protein